MTDLLELAARVEAAEGPDRELFMAAWDAALGFNERSIRSGSRYQCFLAFLDVGAWLDAAMTLVPEGWQFGRMNWSRNGGEVRLTQIVEQSQPGSHAYGEAATPALALCAAALKARSAQP